MQGILRAAVYMMAVLLGAAQAEMWRGYVGTYTHGDSEGIYRISFDGDTGAIALEGLAAEIENPSFLALHPDAPYLYAVGEMSSGGTVSAFKIDSETGDLELINQESAGGRGPCHVAVAPDAKHVAVANYGGGSVSVLPIGDDGALGESIAFFQHEGRSKNKKRQEAPHAHAVNFSNNGKFLLVADLGTDKINIYTYDGAAGKVAPGDPAFASVYPGAGPRHIAFHPSRPFVYVVNELGNTVTTFSWDGGGGMETVQFIDTLPRGFRGSNTTAEIMAHPTGNFIYASNRGHDSIAVFNVDNETGKLSVAGHTKTGGEQPRFFTLDPKGTFLLAANQKSDSVVVFAVNQRTGTLTPTGEQLDIPVPVCLVFTKP